MQDLVINCKYKFEKSRLLIRYNGSIFNKKRNKTEFFLTLNIRRMVVQMMMMLLDHTVLNKNSNNIYNDLNRKYLKTINGGQ